jgi:hypothetical protein
MEDRMVFGYDEIYYALEESVKLQAHYAELLNMHDGGQRIIFKDVKEWLLKLRKLNDQKEK